MQEADRGKTGESPALARNGNPQGKPDDPPGALASNDPSRLGSHGPDGLCPPAGAPRLPLPGSAAAEGLF